MFGYGFVLALTRSMLTAMKDYKNLFSPISIGAMQLPNRIVMSPMTTDYGTADQEPSDRLIAYLEERARGGVGLITVEVCSVAVEHRYQGCSLSIGDDRFIESHRRLVDTLHRYNVKVQPQITHPGPESLISFFEGGQSIGPGVNVNPGAHQYSRALTKEEIPGIIDLYAQGARRAREAGYDGMELHAAHAYMLLGSFLSPLRNPRQDEYGGKSIRHRARLLIETLQACKKAAGDDFPITVSLSGYERFPAGREINESQKLAQMLEEAGADAFRISGGATDRLVTQMVMGSEYPDAANATAAETIKRVVDVPVMVVGRIHTPELAEQILREGRADMIAMARPFLADPHWPDKVRNGRRAAMRQCISCENCIDSMIDYQNLNCAVNAQSGRELDNILTPAAVKKRVLVVGGGAAGMEAARVAQLRGHTVTLIEQQKRLGGSLVLASTVHADNEPMLHWLRGQIESGEVDCRLGQECDEAFVDSIKPDVIIVATGAAVRLPEITGADRPNVYNGVQMRRLVEGCAVAADFSMLPEFLRGPAGFVLRQLSRWLTPSVLRQGSRIWLPMGKRVVIVGGDLAALELAEFLAKRGRKVSILEAGKRLATEIGDKRRYEHMLRLDQLGVVTITEAQVRLIESGGVRFSTGGEELRILPADSVVIAGAPEPELSLQERLQLLAPEVIAIGDCTGLGLIRKATDDAMRVACGL